MSIKALMKEHADLNKELKELKAKIDWDLAILGRLRSSCDAGYDEKRLADLSRVANRYVERCKRYAEIALRMGELVLAMHKKEKVKNGE